MHFPIRILTLCLLTAMGAAVLPAQSYRWQQRARYEMDVRLDVAENQYRGNTRLTYFNNSPDTLRRAFFHLYNNAFQPGSMMDVRSRTIADPDRRVGDRIGRLTGTEMGFLHVNNLQQDGQAAGRVTEAGTILEVDLAQPILPGDSTVFTFEFAGQSPVQIRRSGRDNREGIRFSMSQWYPKLCEYDHHGWHANPYVGREFHGVWSDFAVRITLDKSYVIGGTGVLQNPQEIGHGYPGAEGGPSNKALKKLTELTWHFKAQRVHDFAWAADPDYKHVIKKAENGPRMHFFYQSDSLTEKTWSQLPGYMERAFAIANARFGAYPWEQYAFIQAGDGGMEYPMCTFITGRRGLQSLVGVSVHEMMHSWFQGALAFDESHFSWMDEGFTSYATTVIMGELFPNDGGGRGFNRAYERYFDLVEEGAQEPMTTHADHYQRNYTYSTNAYSKGSMMLHQLTYVIGEAAFAEGMLRFFAAWKFRHPEITDFKRVMEKVSGIELDWYFEYWTNTTHTIDYAISDYKRKGTATVLELRRFGAMPMPVDVKITFMDGETVEYYIPLRIMRGEKVNEVPDRRRIVLSDWNWTNRNYEFAVEAPLEDIKMIELDPTFRLADVDRDNNVLDVQLFLEMLDELKKLEEKKNKKKKGEKKRPVRRE
ncbi:MAG: M1 family metallopeptidase [Bacteroidota bacterium]